MAKAIGRRAQIKRRIKVTAVSRALLKIHKAFPNLPSNMLADLTQVPQRLQQLFDQLARPQDGKYRQGRMALIGLLGRALELYTGGLQQLAEGNVHVWSGCFRGLLETVAAVVYIRKHPSKIVQLLEERGISAGKLRHALAASDEEYGKDINKVTRLVHPADLSLWAVIRPGTAERNVILSLGSRDLSKEEVMKGAAALLQCVDDLIKELETVSSERPSILDEGRIFMNAANP
jgi:hypothetical protein